MSTSTTPQPHKNIFLTILGFMPLIGPTVAAIEQIHQDTIDGATKSQIALEALGVAKGLGEAAAPEFAPEMEAAAELAQNMVNNWVTYYNKAGWTHPMTPALVPVVLATPTSQANSPTK